MTRPTTREVTVDYLANLGPAAACKVTVPVGTPALLIQDGSGAEFWAVADVAWLVEVTGNTHDPYYRYCFIPPDAFA